MATQVRRKGAKPSDFIWAGFILGLPLAVATVLAMVTDSTLGLVVLAGSSLVAGIPLLIGLIGKAVEIGVLAANQHTDQA